MDARTTRIWAGLVSYANATINPAVVDGFSRTVMDCVSWVAIVDSMSGLKWASEEDDAVKYQPSIRALLRSLCSNLPPPESKRLGLQSTGFVSEHTRHMEWRLFDVVYNQNVKKQLQALNFTSAEVENVSEMYKRYWTAYKRGDPTFNMQIPSKDYQDFADPICDFVLSEYQRHRDMEYSRLDRKPRPWPPIFICPRCEKLVMPNRVGRRKYCADCSDLARAQKYRDKAPPGEGRDYQWLYRLLHKESGLRNVFMRFEKNQERLKQIKLRQKSSPRCQRLIEKMHI